MSKGSKRRPTDEAAFASNWDQIFGQKKTGWPEGLLQDDSKALSKWLATRPDSKYVFDKNQVEAEFFGEVVARLQQGGQAGAVGILQHWVKERNKI